MAPTNVNQRIAQLIQQLGLSKNAFAQSLGKTASVIQHLVEGRNKPGYDLLFRIFEVYPNVSRDWLILGRGPLLIAGTAAAPAQANEPPAMAKLPLLDTVGEEETAELMEAPAPRRATASPASSILQPADIVATLALAAATAQPARTSVPAPAVPEPPRVEASAPAAPLPPGASVPPAAVAPIATPDSALAAILQTQYLQHQLALAELRNQHLLEQQKLLREMLEMAQRMS